MMESEAETKGWQAESEEVDHVCAEEEEMLQPKKAAMAASLVVLVEVAGQPGPRRR